MPGRPFTPDQGWSWMVLMAGFFCNVMFDGIIFSSGIFYVEWLDFFDEGHSRTAWVGSVISSVYALVGPIASVLANKYGCRRVTMAGSVMAASSFILCTFSPNVTFMIFTYGVLGGTGFGFMYLSAYVMIGHYFQKRRALATGLVSCGSGVGIFVFAPISNLLIQAYGWRGAMWVISGLVLNGIVMGAIFRPVAVPQTRTDDKSGKEKQKLLSISLLKNPAFLIFCMSSFLCCIGFFVPFIYMPDLARQLDLSTNQSAVLLSVIGITNTIGRIACGYVSDKSWADPLKIYNSALIIGGVATAMCSWLNSFPLLVVYAAVFGFCIAAYVSLCAIILVEFLGLEHLSNSFGFLNMFRGLSTIIGAPLAGFLYDVTGEYHLAFYVAGASIASAGLVCVPLRMLTRCMSGSTQASAIETDLEYSVNDAEDGEGKNCSDSINTYKEIPQDESKRTFYADFKPELNVGSDDKIHKVNL